MYIVHVMVKLHGYITKTAVPCPLYIIKELLVLQNPWPLIHQKKTSQGKVQRQTNEQVYRKCGWELKIKNKIYDTIVN